MHIVLRILQRIMPIIIQLGDKSKAEQRLNFAQAFNPVGSITGVLIGTTCIFSGVELDH